MKNNTAAPYRHTTAECINACLTNSVSADTFVQIQQLPRSTKRLQWLSFTGKRSSNQSVHFTTTNCCRFGGRIVEAEGS
jgi:hypothetical protein